MLYFTSAASLAGFAVPYVKTEETIIYIVTTDSDNCEARLFISLIRYLNAYLKTPCIVLYQIKGKYQRYGRPSLCITFKASLIVRGIIS